MQAQKIKNEKLAGVGFDASTQRVYPEGALASQEQWNEEYDLRLAAIVYAMKKLDTAGIFALNQPREQVYINVELMPPDDTDIERALSFNNPDNIKEWLSIFN